MDEKEKIETLAIVASWKEKFLAIAETKPIGGGWTPEFEDKVKYKALPFWTKYNLMGLLFGTFYYFVKGMWRKALVLIGISIAFKIATGNNIAFFMPFLVTAYHGNIDYYRKIVLGENFWW